MPNTIVTEIIIENTCMYLIKFYVCIASKVRGNFWRINILTAKKCCNSSQTSEAQRTKLCERIFNNACIKQSLIKPLKYFNYYY